MLDQRRRRWSDVVQIVYKWFVFVGNILILLNNQYNISERSYNDVLQVYYLTFNKLYLKYTMGCIASINYADKVS